MNIFVGNLSFDANEGDVKKLFEGFGNVASVVIVMRKEKKAPKSRGFGFVQMPDEQQAFAAIAALNGKEFMGRVLNVNPARPKAEAQTENELKEKRHPKATVEAEQHPREEREQKKTRFNPVFNKDPALKDRRVRPSGQHPALKDRRVRPSGQQGTYKGGRRTHSYMKRRGLAGMQEEAKPRQRSQDNPMRWRKKYEQPKPWQKSSGGPTPWKKAEDKPKPWSKSAGGPKPWKKKEGEFKPWRKSIGAPNPRRKSKPPRRRQSQIESRRKPGGYTR